MRHLSLVIILFSLPLFLPGQILPAPFWSQAKAFGGPQNSPVNKFVRDQFGQYYFTGNFPDSISFDSYVLHSAGLSDVFLTKCDSMANVIWAKRYGGSWFDGGNDASFDAAGNIYFVGGFTSTSITFDTITLINAGPQGIHDGFVVRLDQQGNVAWAKRIGSADLETADDVQVDPFNHVYVSGRFFSPSIIIGNDTLFNGGSSDVWFARFDTSGNAVWAQKIGGPGIETTLMSSDLFGNVILFGRFSDLSITIDTTVLINAGLPNTSDLFIAKADSLGALIWAKRMGGIGNDYGNIVHTTSSGNILLSGCISDTVIIGNDTLASNGGTDVLLSVFDLGGQFLWSRSFGGTTDDFGAAVTSDDAGNIYQSICVTSPMVVVDTTTYYGNGSYDFLIISYTPGGVVRWVVGGGSPGMDGWNGIACEPDGDVCVGGYFSSPGIWLDNIFLSSLGGYDVAFGRLTKDLITGAEQFGRVKEGLFIYPNPATSFIAVELNTSDPTDKIRIYDAQGRLILEQEACAVRCTVDIRSLTPGLYFVHASNGSNSVVGKFIKN